MPSQWSQKRKTIKHYDQIANGYDGQYHLEQDAKITVALKNLSTVNNAIILDAGCGTGLLFPHIAKKAKLVLGIDTSPKLLKQAKTKTKAHNNIAVIRADADHSPFAADTFIHVFAVTLLQNLLNPTKTLEEIKRVTKPNATIVITALKKHWTLEALNKLLEKAEFEILKIKTDENLKDYVAICRKRL